MNRICSPHFEPVAISKYPIPDGLQVECGYLTVPETRSAASGEFPSRRRLRIYVTLVKSLSATPRPDPVVYLYGGPGGHSGRLLQSLALPHLQAIFLGEQDLIVFDQRGSGYSEPALFAPEIDELETDAFLREFSADERAERYISALLQARDRFKREGANLAAVNTPEIAADIDAIRVALGYEQVNLLGISYGTRPALAAMRDFPSGIRSVILDSTVPIQISQYTDAIPNAIYAFDLLFAAIDNDPLASARYPKLKSMFYNVIERLNHTPAQIAAQHPQTGAEITLRIAGDLFVGILCDGFYSRDGVASLPSLIDKAYHEDYQGLAEHLLEMLQPSRPGQPGWSIGMYYSVNCCDDKVTSQSAAEIAEQALSYPAMRSLPLTEYHLGKHIATVASEWGARRAGVAEETAVVSDIPTLILAGQFDQNTPAFWGKLAGETLRNSYYIELPRMGHGVVLEEECAAAVAKAFLADPSQRPDTRCVRALAGGPSLWIL